MTNNAHLNGCDYLMLAFDFELRRRGYAGNSCQIVLDLEARIEAEALQKRITTMVERFPFLTARPGGLIFPRWKRQSKRRPQVRVHRDDVALEAIVNEPLAIGRGELLRFDLIEHAGAGTRLVFTWAHALMDAPGAENFLAMMGREDAPLPSATAASGKRKEMKFSARCKLAWKYIHHLDALCLAAPKTMGVRHPGAAARLHHRFEHFSAAETERVRANGVRLCGVLGDAQFHAAAATFELHRLHLRLKCPTPSYVIPIPVGLRPKGSIEPLFGNQVSMLMVQFLPEDLATIESAAATLKKQLAHGMRNGLLESGLTLGAMFRFLPVPAYMAIVKQGLHGEIGSLFYGDTAAVNSRLTSFLGARIVDFAHVAPITPSPGVGAVFYYFQNQLRLTVLNLLPILSDEEANEFAAALRQRLLEP